MKSSRLYQMFLTVLASLALPTYAAEICPAINCDCESLPNSAWEKACFQHEVAIKKSCESNANTPRDYCSVHGPEAFPLPFKIDLSPLKANGDSQIEDISQKIAALFFSLDLDLANASKKLDKKRFGESLQVLKIVDRNVDNVFEYQRRLVEAYEAKGSNSKSKKSKSKFATQAYASAKTIRDYGDNLVASFSAAEDAKQKKVFRILAAKSLGMSAKLYEQSGYFYGDANKNERAAKSWLKASEVAVSIADLSVLANVNKDYVEFSRVQAAARLQRSGFHWLASNKNKEAEGVLVQSQAYISAGEKALIETMLAEDTEEADQEVRNSGLSRR